jgi:hypothetical protein
VAKARFSYESFQHFHQVLRRFEIPLPRIKAVRSRPAGMTMHFDPVALPFPRQLYRDLFQLRTQGTADLFVEGCLAMRKSAMLHCKSSPYPGIGDDLRLA